MKRPVLTALTLALCSIQVHVLLITLFATTTAFAQPRNLWQRTFTRGNEHCGFYDIFLTDDDNYAVAGWSGVPSTAMWVMLIDRNGDAIWNRTFPANDEGHGHGLATTIIEADNGDFVIGGNIREERHLFTIVRCDSAGRQIWWRFYRDDLDGICNALIETKAGVLLACGAVGPRNQEHAYLTKLESNGDVVWQRIYNDYGGFTAIRETEGGFIVTDGDGSIVKVNDEGEFIWERVVEGRVYGLISCARGGFLASGSDGAGDPRLLRFEPNGDSIWFTRFDPIDEREIGAGSAAVEMQDGGFLFVGGRFFNFSNYLHSQHGMIIRTNGQGEEIWRRVTQNEHAGSCYSSIIMDRDSMVVLVGTDYFARFNAVMIKIVPDRSPPNVLRWEPLARELWKLRNETVSFRVYADDLQNDDLTFRWIHNDSLIGQSDRKRIQFSTSQDHAVVCEVSDGQDAVNIDWLVHVRDLYIIDHSLDSLELSVDRNDTVNFTITTETIYPDSVIYHWYLNEDAVAEGENASIVFPHPGRNTLTARATIGDYSDEIVWSVNVRSVIWSWEPESLNIGCVRDSTINFALIALDEESDSIEYRWTLGDSIVSIDSLAVIEFPSIGEYLVEGLIVDNSVLDSIVWHVTVHDPSGIHTDDSNGKVRGMALTLHPNPSNSGVAIEYFLPARTGVSIDLLDLYGRVAMKITESDQSPGQYQAMISSRTLPSGIYIVRLKTATWILHQKLVVTK